MLEPIVTFFEKLIENFSWRRLVFLMIILGLSIAGLWAFESYTSSFRLSRIERQAALLEKLATLSSQPALKSDIYLQRANENLQKQLEATTNSSSGEYELLPWGKKVLATVAAWLVFATFLLLLPGSYSAEKGGRLTVFMGVVLVASPFVALSAAIPTFNAVWVNYLVYPIGHISVFVILVLLSERRKKRLFLAKLRG